MQKILVNILCTKPIVVFILTIGFIYSYAHPMPNSFLKLMVNEKSIKAQAFIPYIELENALPTQKDSLKSNLFLEKYFLNHINAVSGNQRWDIRIDQIKIDQTRSETVGNYREIVVDFEMKPLKIENLRNFKLHFDAVIHQVVTHSILVSIVQDWQNGINQELPEHPIGTITYDFSSLKVLPLEVSLEQGSRWKGFKSMFVTGMIHIQLGFDHLLFLLTLLLPTFMGVQGIRWTGYTELKSGFINILKIVSAFTIGHSVTLLLGSFQLVSIPIQWIEVTIAISILISAIHCIIPIFYQYELWIAIGFGLIHGLAFSETLQILNLSTINLFLSLLGFNLGIEVMQVAIILTVLPWIWLLSQTRSFNILKTVLAILIAIAAIGWAIERIVDAPNMVSELTDQLFNFSYWLIIGFAAISIIIYIIEKLYKK